MTKRPSPPSAHDVARVAGVSQAAVSRAFTPGASIAEATRAKVLRAAKSLGYRPNLIARSLIKGRSGIIGIVIGPPRNVFFMSALSMLLTRLKRLGKHALVFTMEGSANADMHVDDLLKFRVEAVVLMAATLSPKLDEQCRGEGIPIIHFGRRPRSPKKCISITGNNQEGGRQIAEHLLRQGYKRPAVIVGLLESATTREREAGFTSYLKAQGLPTPEREVVEFERAGAIEAARRLLTRKPRPDAIFCANDDMAIATIEVARYEFGLEVGRQIGIAGFDDIEQAAWPSFDLTTYSLPMQDMVEAAGDLLSNPNEIELPAHRIVKGVLKARRSTQRNGA